MNFSKSTTLFFFEKILHFVIIQILQFGNLTTQRTDTFWICCLVVLINSFCIYVLKWVLFRIFHFPVAKREKKSIINKSKISYNFLQDFAWEAFGWVKFRNVFYSKHCITHNVKKRNTTFILYSATNKYTSIR